MIGVRHCLAILTLMMFIGSQATSSALGQTEAEVMKSIAKECMKGDVLKCLLAAATKTPLAGDPNEERKLTVQGEQATECEHFLTLIMPRLKALGYRIQGNGLALSAEQDKLNEEHARLVSEPDSPGRVAAEARWNAESKVFLANVNQFSKDNDMFTEMTNATTFCVRTIKRFDRTRGDFWHLKYRELAADIISKGQAITWGR